MWLSKKVHKGLNHSRYFVLSPQSFSYFHSLSEYEQGRPPSLSLPLQHITLEDSTNTNNDNNNNNNKDKDKDLFLQVKYFDGANQKRLTVQFKDETDKNAWKKEIIRAKRKCEEKADPVNVLRSSSSSSSPVISPFSYQISSPTSSVSTASSSSLRKIVRQDTHLDFGDLRFSSPTSVSLSPVTDCSFPVSALCFFHLFLSDDALYSLGDFHSSRSCEVDFKSSSWKSISGSDNQSVRNISLRVPVEGSPFGPDSTRVLKVQRRSLDPSSGSYQIETIFKTPDAPFGDCLLMQDVWSVSVVSSSSCTVSMSCGLTFLKQPFKIRMLKSTIESRFFFETKNSLLQWIEKAKAFIQQNNDKVKQLQQETEPETETKNKNKKTTTTTTTIITTNKASASASAAVSASSVSLASASSSLALSLSLSPSLSSLGPSSLSFSSSAGVGVGSSSLLAFTSAFAFAVFILIFATVSESDSESRSGSGICAIEHIVGVAVGLLPVAAALWAKLDGLGV